jgi:nocardicin N-oxygenase
LNDEIPEFPTSAAHGGDLAPDFELLRARTALPWVRLPDGTPARLVTGHEDVRTVLSDTRFTRDLVAGDQAPRSDAVARTVNQDGRPHAELRVIASRAFSVRQTAVNGPRIQELADTLIDDMVRGGAPADLVGALAAPLPALVICELLGLPAADQPLLREWCDRITAVGTGPDQDAWRGLGGYVDRAVRARQAELKRSGQPPTDLIGRLVHAQEENPLAHGELVSVVLLVLAGGLETTQTAIAGGVLRLLQDPAGLRQFGDDQGLVETACEEILRYQPIIDHNRAQRATQDVHLGGELVRAGEIVQVSINAANRDPAVFSKPDEFAVGRRPNPHLAFGHGAHHCLGAALARLQLTIVVSTLARRLPGLTLAEPAERLRWRGGHVTLRLEELPVAW